MEYMTYRLTTEEMEAYLNATKNILLEELYVEGLISKEVFENYTKHYVFIIKKPSFFGGFWKKLLSKSAEHEHIILVKELSLSKQLDAQKQKNEKPNKEDRHD